MAAPSIAWQVEADGQTVFITPMKNLGELDCFHLYDEVAGTFQLLETGPYCNVVLDLKHTDFFGSAALNGFMRLWYLVRARRGRMAMCNVSANGRQILRLMRMDRFWTLCPDRDQATTVVNRRTSRVLIVDDSEIDRRLATGLLSKDAQFEITHAHDGLQALESIKTSIPDLVLTDLVMPRMDGLELIAAIRQMCPGLPVVLLTAYGNEEIAAAALSLGAASFVPKSVQAERLLETVRRVLARAVARQPRNLAACQSKIECSFFLGSDPALIDPLVDYVQYSLTSLWSATLVQRMRIGIALEEALLNALYHGSLEISGHDLAAARLAKGGVDDLVRQRLADPELSRRRIHVDIHLTSHSARFVVRDDGPGFNLSDSRFDCLAQSFERGTNRGFALMQTLMDEVSYNELGNEVTLIKLPD